MVKTPAVIFSRSSQELGTKLAMAVGGEEICSSNQNLMFAMQVAYREQRPIVAIFATAIVIRAIAHLIGSKYFDPPVVSVSRDGQFTVPLLGLHHGAWKLTRQIVDAIGGVSTFATGTSKLVDSPLDEPMPGYIILNGDDYKEFAQALIDGGTVQISGHAPWLDKLPKSDNARLRITVTEKAIEGAPDHLVYAAETLAVGVGCERGITPNELRKLVDDTLQRNGLSPHAVACYASLDIKEDEPAIAALASSERLRLFSSKELARETPRVSSPSEIVQAATGTPSVAEAAALAAAGADATLIVTKTKSARATCAIARSPHPILEYRGRERGSLKVIGLGPGSKHMRSPTASSELWAATDWVGYDLYLDLCQDMHHTQTEHRFPLGGEEERVRHAIALAKQGKQVALVCSGDAGIYAMAALVYEIIDLEPCRIAVEVIPGVSAFQAAAAKAGAMIGHDFCCISLSDLLTPWEVIEKRVRAAAEGDFVISFYNPRSLKRRDQLERAFAILAKHRPAETPVVVASNLGRPEEKVRIVRFDEFNPDDVDMLTLVMVGSSQSKSLARGDGRTYAYTPRGYAKKREQA